MVFRLLFVFSCMLLSRMVCSQFLEKKRNAGYPFEISLDKNKKNLFFELMPKPYSLAVGIPLIGIYGPEYFFRKRLVLIELDPSMRTNMPHMLQKSLEGIDKNWQQKNPYYFIIIHGEGKPGNTIYNMVFHPFAYAFEKKAFFNITMPMGIFEPSHAQRLPHGIAFNTFKGENINVHPPQDISPNNAQFVIEEHYPITKFWSVAYAPNKSMFGIYFNIIINDPALAQHVRRIILDKTIETLSQLLAALIIFADMDEVVGDIQAITGTSLHNFPLHTAPPSAQIKILGMNLQRLRKKMITLHNNKVI